MMIVDECPIDAVQVALDLASRLEVKEIPLDFEPEAVRWRRIVAEVARLFSNHEELLAELDRVLKAAYRELGADCGFLVANPEQDPTSGCSERRLAEYHLREAALDAAEKACQRWMARKALQRSAAQNR